MTYLYKNRTNQSTLRKQGWAFIYSRCFRELHSEKNIQMIVFKKLYRELCSWNNIQRIIENYIQGITFRELHSENYIKKTFKELHLENNIQQFSGWEFSEYLSLNTKNKNIKNKNKKDTFFLFCINATNFSLAQERYECYSLNIIL